MSPCHPQPHVVASLEERLGAEMDEAHVLLAQDQRLTHMALVQEVAAARRDLGCTAHELTSAHEESDQCLHESRGAVWSLPLTSLRAECIFFSMRCNSGYLSGSSLLQLNQKLKLSISLEEHVCLVSIQS
jgi:hypothetical protein